MNDHSIQRTSPEERSLVELLSGERLPQEYLSGEQASTVVEYVGIGAVGTMLVSCVVAVIDSMAGDHIGRFIVSKMLRMIAIGE